MRKLFILSFLILSFGSFSQKNKLKAYLDTKQFYATELGNYLEIYLQFVGSSVKFEAVDNGIQAKSLFDHGLVQMPTPPKVVNVICYEANNGQNCAS